VLIEALRIVAADDPALVAAVGGAADLDDAVARLGQPVAQNLRRRIIDGRRRGAGRCRQRQ